MKPGRNDPCICGSGKKYKYCCAGKALSRPAAPSPAEFDQLVALYNTGRYAELERRARSLVEQYPGSGFAWKLLGIALLRQGRAALPALQKAAELLPGDAEAHFNLATVLQNLGRLDDAVASYRRALKTKPGFAEALNNLGNALKDLGLLDDAIASFRKALEINPNFAEAHYNLGYALMSFGLPKDAVACYCRSLEIKPNYASTHNNLGTALKDLGLLDDAIASYRRALEIDPGLADVYSNLLFTLNYTTDYSPAYLREEARQYGRMVARKVAAPFTFWQCDEHPKRLRVGMVSGDLRAHSVGHFMDSLLAQLDPARVEMIAYPTNREFDQLTARIKPCFAAWKPLFGLSDQAAAQLIHADGVHVLIDLAGHTAHNRLPVFAWKPAPVQVSWLGYGATTGVAEMDYLLADEAGVPEARRENFSETVWYLPDTRLCFTPPEVEAPVAPLPALQNGCITFGCFQTLEKAGNDVLETWAKILAALPGARLRWQCKQFWDPTVAKQLALRLQRHGIDPGRATMHGAGPREEYLEAHAEVDMILDTFPFPGGTTTCEALWMGVPTLTLAGETLLARQGASLNSAAGLHDWIATSVEDYIHKAVALAGDLPMLAALRAGLREQVSASPLFDSKRFARNLEDALWGMWRAHAQRA